MDTTIITTKRKNTVKTPSTSVVSDGTTNNLFAQVLLEYKKNNGKNSSFQGFRTKLTEYANFGVKEDDNLALFYSSEEFTGNNIEDSTKCCIVDKQQLKIVMTQFNKIIFNQEAIDFLKTTDWSDVSVYPCHEGTMIIVFYEHDRWYVTTRKCLNANESVWIKDLSYGQMFQDAISGKFKLDDLNKNYCYYFVLLHYKNRNLVAIQKDNTTNVAHVLTTEKYTLNEVNYEIKAPIIKPKNIMFDSINSVLKQLKKISDDDQKNGSISTEGFILQVKNEGVLTFLKLQTEVYQNVSKNKPNNRNYAQIFLELYQKDLLTNYAHYYTEYSKDVVNRISNSMKTITQEICDIYHATRNHKNQALYELLPSSYKKALFEIHGLFIKRKNKEIQRINTHKISDESCDDEDFDNLRYSKIISIHDVYYYLKSLPFNDLRKIYIARYHLIENNMDIPCLNTGCMDSLMQAKLML